MATFVSLQRTESECGNFTYFLHAADKSCPVLRGSTVIVVNDDPLHIRLLLHVGQFSRPLEVCEVSACNWLDL